MPLRSILMRVFFLLLIASSLQSGFAAARPLAPNDLSLSYGTGKILHLDTSGDLQGERLAYTRFPVSWQFWGRHVRLALSTALAHYHSDTRGGTPSVFILSLGPIARYYIAPNNPCAPYIELGVSPSYLNKTKLGDRELGIHFTFQDMAGIGITLAKRFEAALHIMHYSNAHLYHKNRGITVPLVFTLGYRF